MQSSPFRIFLWKCFVISIKMDRKENLILNQLQSLKDMKVTTTSQRGMTNKSSIMNGFSSRQYYLRKKTLQGILSVVLIIQLLLFHCYFEFDIQSKQSSINFLHAGQLCGAIGCIIILINYYQQRLYQHYTGEQLENMSEVIRKILFFLIMPYEFLNNYTIDFTYADSSSNVVQDVDFSQKVNYLLVIFACFRASYFITTVLIRTRYMSPRSVRISKLFGFTPGILYCIKSIFKDNPFSFITTIFLISFFMFSFAFRIAENVIYTTTPLGTYGNMAWMTVVTMTTVGYGDYTPRTQLGRIIGALCVTWGVLIVSVMVVVLTRAFSMDKNQSQALNIMRKLQTNTELRQYAGQFLRESLWRFWKNYKLKKTMKNLGKEETKYTLRPIKDTMKERKLMLRFRNFRRLRNVSKITESDADFSNETIRQFQRAFINLQNLAANNMMIINYLHEEYIFKENEDQQDEHMLVVDQVEEQSQTSMI